LHKIAAGYKELLKTKTNFEDPLNLRVYLGGPKGPVASSDFAGLSMKYL
jgi:hypothetical protein